MSDVTLIRKPTIAVFVAHLAALAPLTASLGLVLVLVLGGPDQLRGSVYVLRLVSPDGDLWLGFTGACAARGESVVCRTAPATAYFTDVEASLALPLSLSNALPSDLGAPSALLLVSCASLALSLALLIWGSIDFRYAQLWQLEHKDGWLGELLLARRLEILGVVSALIAYVLGNVANSSTQSVGQAAVSTIAAVAGPQAYAELGGALRMLQASGYLVLLAILITLGLLAFDTMLSRVRKEYVELAQDVRTLVQAAHAQESTAQARSGSEHRSKSSADVTM